MADAATIFRIDRPHERLWTCYILKSLATLPALPFILPYYYFRYHTMRYRFDEEGLSMSWGILFRRQIVLNYARIQDIHLRSNVIERWLGLARIEVQTASGSGGAEMTIEGLLEYEAVRDFLYERMRGGHQAQSPLEQALHEVAGELREVRRLLEARLAQEQPRD
ncbi:MAG: PH domain-containing protein [Bryobacteraceae bacterium]|nr:PH domain-containing protein [Bryobacteraceae bacterium]